jgi:hypothetical protein
MHLLLQWEKADNKPVIVAYFAAAFGALFTAEWLIHLPALDFVSGPLLHHANPCGTENAKAAAVTSPAQGTMLCLDRRSHPPNGQCLTPRLFKAGTAAVWPS